RSPGLVREGAGSSAGAASRATIFASTTMAPSVRLLQYFYMLTCKNSVARLGREGSGQPPAALDPDMGTGATALCVHRQRRQIIGVRAGRRDGTVADELLEMLHRRVAGHDQRAVGDDGQLVLTQTGEAGPPLPDQA